MATTGNADFDAVREDLAALRRQVAELLKHSADAARSGTADLRDELRDLPERGAESLRAQVRESPLASIAIAFIAGSIIGRLLR
ncbi:MAG TPA: hypothetical protein VMT54_02890 [Candidatus Cybelea sp.]|nr:hypothetical protein [Candidatus Cybelea sp.]